jgi:multidrug resistance efflux pump
MPITSTAEQQGERHSDDINDIINKVPSWILRWGTTLFFFVIALIIMMSALIRYPDIVKTQLKVSSPDMPKQVISKITGKLIKLLVANDAYVKSQEPLAYIESTANHQQVLELITRLKKMQQQVAAGQPADQGLFSQIADSELGELQVSFQAFSQSYLAYRSTVENGFLTKKRAYLQQDIASLNKQAGQLKAEKEVQQRDYSLAEDEYRMHQKLEKSKVETPAELRQQESKYLSKKSPLIQTDAALLTAQSNYLAKQKEILELDNQVVEEKSRFAQALNSLISQAEDWRNKYVLLAPQAGRVSFAGIIQQNQTLNMGQDVFYINTGNDQYFGEMTIPQNNLGKVKTGQEVLIKLKSYPFEEYGIVLGRISYIADVPYRDSIFISRVNITSKLATDMKKPIFLKQGMSADAEIVTEDATVLQRIFRNVIKAINSN